jgi:hypothetical protein
LRTLAPLDDDGAEARRHRGITSAAGISSGGRPFDVVAPVPTFPRSTTTMVGESMPRAVRRVCGEARHALIDAARLDRALLDAAYAQCDEPARRSLGAEADAELAPFRARMAPEAYEQSRHAAVDRLLRERRGLPLVTFE